MKTLNSFIFTFAFLSPLVSFAYEPLPLGLRIKALMGHGEAQFQMGLEMERYRGDIPRAKIFYFKAIEKKHPDTANRMAVLMESENQTIGAIYYHKQAIEWDTHGVFSSLASLNSKTWISKRSPIEVYTWEFSKRINPSQWIHFNCIRFEISSPGAASALALGRIYRAGYISVDNQKVLPNIEESDSWYNKALDLGTPAALIGASLDSFGDKEAAMKWFIKALKESEYILYTHFQMGNYYKTKGEYTKAIASYKKALECEFKTEEDYTLGASAALALARIHREGIPEKEIPKNPELAKSFYERAFQIGLEGQWEVFRKREEEIKKYSPDAFNSHPYFSIDPEREIKLHAYRLGVARFIAGDYHDAYLKNQNKEDFELAQHWYRKALSNREISSYDYHKTAAVLKLVAPSESCEESFEKTK